jgi:hypothetical protein
MNITGIIWLEDIVEKLETKHAIKPIEVVEVLDNLPWFRFVEKGIVLLKMCTPPLDKPKQGDTLSSTSCISKTIAP